MQTVINNFVEQVIQSGLYKPMDYSYVKNRILALVGEEGANTSTSEKDIKTLLLQFQVLLMKISGVLIKNLLKKL